MVSQRVLNNWSVKSRRTQPLPYGAASHSGSPMKPSPSTFAFILAAGIAAGCSGDSSTTDATISDGGVDDSSGVADTSVADTTVADTAIEDTAVEDTAVADTAIEDTAVADTAVEDTTVEDTAVEDTTVADITPTDVATDSAPTDVATDSAPTDVATDTAPTDVSLSGTDSTAGILCAFSDSGDQRLVYELVNRRTGVNRPIDAVLGFNFAWTCGAEQRSLSGNGVPNHTVADGAFATAISAQSISYAVSLAPELTDGITAVREPGFALNGIKFEPATAGTCPDDAEVDTECDYGAGSDTWQMVATPGDVSPWRFGFGVDENDAHVQPNGQYHYHGNPVRFVDALNPDFATSMTLVGWATDGFPIYPLYGYSNPNDAGSVLAIMQSSYRTVDTPAAGRPSVADFPLGHFEQDWTYVAGSGDLDECNGRFGATPEFPDGIYHYYITPTYPSVQRCVRGTSAPGTGGPPRP